MFVAVGDPSTGHHQCMLSFTSWIGELDLSGPSVSDTVMAETDGFFFFLLQV